MRDKKVIGKKWRRERINKGRGKRTAERRASRFTLPWRRDGLTNHERMLKNADARSGKDV